jgi:hypothetical protein
MEIGEHFVEKECVEKQKKKREREGMKGRESERKRNKVREREVWMSMRKKACRKCSRFFC